MILELILETLIFGPIKSATIFLMGKISKWCWQIHSAPVIKIQIDPSKPFPRINQYPTSKEGMNPIIEDYKAQGLIFPCIRPCNTPILLMRKPKGWR